MWVNVDDLDRRRRDQRSRQRFRAKLGAAGIVAVIVLIFAALIGWNRQIEADNRRDCVAIGGHLERQTSYAYKSSSTSYFCLTPDGRVLWIR